MRSSSGEGRKTPGLINQQENMAAAADVIKTSRLWMAEGRPGGKKKKEEEEGEKKRKKTWGWDSQPWPRSLSVNTVTPVKPAPVRFILWAWRRADGPIAETELLCDYGKTGKIPLRVIITDWQCQGVSELWHMAENAFSCALEWFTIYSHNKWQLFLSLKDSFSGLFSFITQPLMQFIKIIVGPRLCL